MLHIIMQVYVLTSILSGMNGLSGLNDMSAFALTQLDRQFLPGQIQLRWAPQELNETQVRQMIETNGFYERRLNPHGNLPNVYLPMSIHGQVFVTDTRHDLLWATGVDLYVSSESAAERIADLCYAGYNDWRLPTLEELASLLEAPKGRTQHYNAALSDAPLDTTLTSDMAETEDLVWSVRFDQGIVTPVERYAFWRVLPVRSGSKLPIRSTCRRRL